MGKFFIVFALLSLPALASDETAGTLRLYRWEAGARAENVYALETTLAESDYHSLLNSPAPFALAHKKELFSGCYLASFASVRAPASSGTKTNLKKICFPR